MKAAIVALVLCLAEAAVAGDQGARRDLVRFIQRRTPRA
jgi:hypothetical protein